jgi:CxxC-x17-CxxC domain-containing protein
VYLKLMIDGIAGDAFSATTLPPIKLEDLANEGKIIRASRERYSTSKADVEEKIRRWTGMLSDAEKEELRRTITEPSTPPTPTLTITPTRSPYKKEEHTKSAFGKEKREQAINVEKALQKKTETPKSPPAVPVQKSAPAVLTVPTQDLPEQVAAAETEKERPLFEALCATCEKSIQVPFQPDVSRPTFCKDCLKDYQRAVAKERQAIENTQKNGETAPPQQPRASQGKPAVYRGTEAPMLLGQMKHVAPKKFKPLRSKAEPDFAGLRAIVQAIRPPEEVGE